MRTRNYYNYTEIFSHASVGTLLHIWSHGHVMQSWQSLIEQHLQKAKQPLVVVVGSTASGKTRFSIKIAEHIMHSGGIRGHAGVKGQAEEGLAAVHFSLPLSFVGQTKESGNVAEIINSDSRQLYRYLHIGTTKITEEEKQGIPHHLFDVLNPKEGITVARYQEQATHLIHEIHARGHVPILVGGSMLYISSIIDGLKTLPPADPLLRKRLEEEYDKDGGRALHAKLTQIDPEAASSIHQNNKPYLVRALEIFETTGEPASTQKHQKNCPYDLLIFGMQWTREELVQRINERTKTLLESGWIEEVESLLQKGFSLDDRGMKSLGYHEIAEWIQKGKDPETFSTLRENIAAKTRQYAKRQMTWWRGDERIQWIHEENKKLKTKN